MLPYTLFVRGWGSMSEDNALKKILDAWRKSGEDEFSNTDVKLLIEILTLIRSELQLVDKTSRKREILQWYLNTVKGVLEECIMARLLKIVLTSIKRAEKISRDANSLSWFLTLMPNGLDLTHIISHPPGDNRGRRTVAIVLRDIEKFVGEDGKEYGPYPAGCLVNIPDYVARLLEEKKAVEEIFIT
jgi:hypothetical protein